MAGPATYHFRSASARKVSLEMGLFSSRGQTPTFAVDCSAMTTTYTNQLWIIQNRQDVITQWWCAPDNPSSRSPLNMPAVALAFNYYMTKRVLSALSAVVTPEELILDFGVNTQTEPNSTEPVRLTNRLVMDFSTAKRAWKAFQNVVREHEQSHGEKELDW